jgi:cyclopropane-fatty-acyl-phospholipid synthase
MITKEAVIEYYADKANGVHRFNTEEFFELEAREKLFHMGSGQALLDFGCGSGDLLAYYAPQFGSMLGVDLSDNMVRRARQRLDRFGLQHVQVAQADEGKVWEVAGDRRFDVITSAGVMQYLSGEQIAAFLTAARPRLAAGGRVTMFDLVDPRLYWLLKYGWFRDRPLNPWLVVSAVARTGRIWTRKLVRRLSGRAEDHIGYTHHPLVVQRAAEQTGYRCRIVCSMFYEYRYHALLTPAT